MAALAVIALGTIVLAVLLIALLPGAGLIAAIVVVVLGIGTIIWLSMASAARTTPSEALAQTKDVEHLGPGGPDDPRSR
jgi:hypothetical protein